MSSQEFNSGELEKIINEVCISNQLYDEMKLEYNKIGDWLDRGGSSIKQYNPIIYPQGSVSLQTMIQPLGKNSYDVDIVCEFRDNIENMLPSILKELISDEMMKYSNEHEKLSIKSGNRCVTAIFNKNIPFHMDILPAISEKDFNFKTIKESEYSKKMAIKITDNYEKELTWTFSNPKGLSNWISERKFEYYLKGKSFNRAKEELPKSKELIIPDFNKIVMLLKRHRDIYFYNERIEPSSVMITLMIAHILTYEVRELSLYEKLVYCVNRMLIFIDKVNGKFYLPNPYHSGENFLDKWNNYPEIEISFNNWVKDLLLQIESNSLIDFYKIKKIR